MSWILKLPKKWQSKCVFCIWGLMVIFSCLAWGYVLFTHQKGWRTGAYWWGEISQEICVYSECESSIYTVFITVSSWHCVWGDIHSQDAIQWRGLHSLHKPTNWCYTGHSIVPSLGIYIYSVIYSLPAPFTKTLQFWHYHLPSCCSRTDKRWNRLILYLYTLTLQVPNFFGFHASCDQMYLWVITIITMSQLVNIVHVVWRTRNYNL